MTNAIDGPRKRRKRRRRVRPSLRPRVVHVGVRKTSLRLEPVMWDALAEIATEHGRSVHDVVTEISLNYDAPNLSAAIRVYIVEFYRDRLHASAQPPQSDALVNLRE